MQRQFEELGAKVTPTAKAAVAFEIMPANWTSFMAFLECQTQWRVVAGMAGLVWLGLDYTACRLVLDSLLAEPTVFADLRFLEAAALPILNEVD